MSKIGLGTWRMGVSGDDEKDIAAIHHAVNRGLTHIDTAESYGDGLCEDLVGRAIKKFPRQKLFIATKVREQKLEYADVIKSCKESLERLGTPYIDLFYVHKPSPTIPVEETARALNELLELGLIKHVGLSNVSVKTIQEYQKFLSAPVYAVQNHYNLVCRESRVKGIIDFCAQNDIKFYAWRPIKVAYPEDMEFTLDKCEMLCEMAEKYGKTTAQIAVRWILQQDDVRVLFKSSSPKHIDEIIEAEEFQLTESDWEKLDKDFPVQKVQTFTGSSGYMDVL